MLELIRKVRISTKLLLIGAVFLNGAAVLSVELIGARLLAPFFGSTIYVWASLLTVAMAGLSLGYFIGGMVADRYPKLPVLFTAFGSGGAYLLILHLFSEYVFFASDGFGLVWGPLVAACIMYMAPMFFWGMVSPIAVRMSTESVESVGVTAGNLYAMATFGSLVGALATGFYLLAEFSVYEVILFFAGGVTAISALVLLAFSSNRKAQFVGAFFGLLLLIIFSWGFGQAENMQDAIDIAPEPQELQGYDAEIYEPAFAYDDVIYDEHGRPSFEAIRHTKGIIDAQIIHSEPSQYGDITVFDFGAVRCFLIDGANESCWNFAKSLPSEYEEDIMHMLENAAPDAEDVLIIGVGGGTLLKELAQSGKAEQYRIDAVEINPKMPRVAEKYFHLPKNLDFTIYIDDGRHFLSSVDKKYDAIILDICNVHSANAHLWTKEFYQLAKQHLKDPMNDPIIATRGSVNDVDILKLDHMIANAMHTYFENLYHIRRADLDSGGYDVTTYMTIQKEVDFAEYRFLVREWQFDPQSDIASDDVLDEMGRLFLPGTEAIIEQAKRNFGEELLLPVR